MHKGTTINEADVTDVFEKKICNVSACIRVTHFDTVKAERGVLNSAYFSIWPLFLHGCAETVRNKVVMPKTSLHSGHLLSFSTLPPWL